MIVAFETQHSSWPPSSFTVLVANLTAYIATVKPQLVMPASDAQLALLFFQLTYTYEARKPGVKDKIVDMALNGAGVRDTARVLKVGINTVLRTLKNSTQGK